MQWKIHGERIVYDSPWMRVALADVEPPGAARFEHHVLRSTADAAGVVVHDPERGILLIHRHRFTTDSWGWEIPAGRIDTGETPVVAGDRETLEETGWQPGPLTPLVVFHPTNGSSDLTFHIFTADHATHVGDPTDITEAAEVAWKTVDEVRDIVRSGQMPDGLSLTAVLAHLSDIVG